MGFNTNSIILKSNIDIEKIEQWFYEEGFEKANFENGSFESTSSGIYHRFKENKPFNTFLKEDIGGSLLVFEVNVSKTKVDYITYSPIMLFGLFPIKISFKEKSSALSEYRSNGYKKLKKFEQFIEQ
jgi:hypothetical protein